MTSMTSQDRTQQILSDIIDNADTYPISSEISDEIRTDILNLKNLIDTNAPISELLVRIHKDLHEKPDTFAVLSDSEISTIISGIKIHTKRELIVGKEKPKFKKSYSMDDLDL